MTKKIIRIIFSIIITLTIIMAIVYASDNYYLEIDAITENMLTEMGISDCHIVKCGIYEKSPHKGTSMYISEGDKEEYINNLLNERAYREQITDRSIVQWGDLAIADYKIFYMDKQISSVKDEPIRVGSGYYDIQLENALIDLEVGQEYSIRWEMPQVTYSNDLTGKELKIEIIITDIYRVITPTKDEYAVNYGYLNAEEFELTIENMLYEEMKDNLLEQQIEEYLNSIVSNSKFRINEDAVVDNAVSYYFQYNSMSGIYNMDLKDYVQDILDYEGDIYQLCYEESAYEIKRYLVIGRLVKEMEIRISDRDIEAFYEEHNIDPDKITDEQLCYIKYNIVETKLIKAIIHNYINSETPQIRKHCKS